MGPAAGLDLLPALAREAIRAHLERRAPAPHAAEGPLARRAAVFVTLRLDGALRGCIGCLEPRLETLAAETMDRAVAAATTDPRFAPLVLHELDHCTIDVSVLGALEPVASPAQLDPRRYGVAVSDGAAGRGVLLPGVEGVKTAVQQVELARKKAGIARDAPVSIRRFEVVKITG